MTPLHPVILGGGSGTRLWPESRKAYPKQFAPLLGEKSLYQRTLLRFSREGFTAPLVMTGEDFRFMAVEQAGAVGLSDAHVVVEPVGRDTAPAILAAALILEDTPEDLMIVAPSDHVITDADAFHAAIEAGRNAADDGALVTFGITPDRTETGFGYLQLENRPDGSVTPVSKFTEKPDLETARAMVDDGAYLWNAGLFMGRVDSFIAAFEEHAGDLLQSVRAAVDAAKSDLDFTRLDHDAFAQARAVSVDYAIMEKMTRVVAVPMQCGWSDLGAWDALWSVSNPDAEGNVKVGDVTAIGCEDTYLRSESGVALVGLGLRDMVAVAMRDAVLVADKSRAQEVKSVVEALRADGFSQADDYPRFHRPWGWYETLCLGDRFQVKRIMVKPGGVLSLQSHRHRAEHWVVVEGTAEITIGDEVMRKEANESVYIPLGARHRMANPMDAPMYLIEVQTGSYLGEDDIVRYEDIYDRK